MFEPIHVRAHSGCPITQKIEEAPKPKVASKRQDSLNYLIEYDPAHLALPSSETMFPLPHAYIALRLSLEATRDG